jgi:hypothetical protein
MNFGMLNWMLILMSRPRLVQTLSLKEMGVMQPVVLPPPGSVDPDPLKLNLLLVQKGPAVVPELR